MEVEDVGDFGQVDWVDEEDQEVFSQSIVCFQFEAREDRCGKNLDDISILVANRSVIHTKATTIK